MKYNFERYIKDEKEWIKEEINIIDKIYSKIFNFLPFLKKNFIIKILISIVISIVF